jgi:hypothetical protein
MMLEKRKEMLEKQGVHIEYIELTVKDQMATTELPILFIDDKTFTGKDALLKIRELSPTPPVNI